MTGIIPYGLAGNFCPECGRAKMLRLYDVLTGCGTCDEVIIRHRCTGRPDIADLPHMLAVRAVEPTRQLKLVFDEEWPEGGVIRDGEFAVPWPRAAFDAVEPGGTFEIHDEIWGSSRSAYVTFIRAEQAGDGTMRLIVRNTGWVP